MGILPFAGRSSAGARPWASGFPAPAIVRIARLTMQEAKRWTSFWTTFPERTEQVVDRAARTRKRNYGLPALKASRIRTQAGPDLVPQARCATAAPDCSAVTIAGWGLESMATPFWRMR